MLYLCEVEFQTDNPDRDFDRGPTFVVQLSPHGIVRSARHIILSLEEAKALLPLSDADFTDRLFALFGVSGVRDPLRHGSLFDSYYYIEKGVREAIIDFAKQ